MVFISGFIGYPWAGAVYPFRNRRNLADIFKLGPYTLWAHFFVPWDTCGPLLYTPVNNFCDPGYTLALIRHTLSRHFRVFADTGQPALYTLLHGSRIWRIPASRPCIPLDLHFKLQRISVGFPYILYIAISRFSVYLQVALDNRQNRPARRAVQGEQKRRRSSA